MSYRLLALPLLSLPIVSTPVHADSTAELDTMVVTATRTPTDINQLGSSITVISAAEIERRQFQTLTDALQDVPGLNIVQLGVKGTQTSVFMRGTNSDHVLVLVDGIEMNDPSSPNGSFDFGLFLLDGIESIEIVRGLQSVLYGADAIGGVIQIRTRNGEGKLLARGKFEGGKNSTHHETFALSGSAGDVNYATTVGFLKTDGESIATEKRLAPGSTSDDDGYDNKMFSTKLGWQPSSQFEATVTARYIETKTDIDGGFDFSGNTMDDPDATNDSDQLYLGAEFKGNFADSRWQPTLLLTRTDIDRKNRNDRQDPFGTLEHTNFNGDKNKFGLQNDLYFFDNHLITVGAEYEDEDMDSDGFTDFGGFIITQDTHADRQTSSGYIQDQITITDQLFATVGVRYDDPDDYDSEVTYRATTSYQLTKATRLTGAYGTGFKAPSLFQLYGHTPNNFGSEFRGNPNLKAETSHGWEVGINQLLWNDRIKGNLTYYRSDIDDLITTIFLPGFNSTTINRDEVDIHGVESTLSIAALSNLDINLNYTFTHTEDENDDELLRRPKNKASVNIDFRVTDKMTFSSSLLYTGSRYDVNGLGTRIKRGGYSVMNVAANYQLTPKARIFGRIDNLGDKEYEPAYGFQALGHAAYVGFELVNR